MGLDILGLSVFDAELEPVIDTSGLGLPVFWELLDILGITDSDGEDVVLNVFNTVLDIIPETDDEPLTLFSADCDTLALDVLEVLLLRLDVIVLVISADSDFTGLDDFVARGETELVVVIDADLDTLDEADRVGCELTLTKADLVVESVPDTLPLNDADAEAELEWDTDILVVPVWLTELDSEIVCVFDPEYVEITDAVRDGDELIEYVGVFEDVTLTLSVTFTKLLVFVFVVIILWVDLADNVIVVFPVRDPDTETVDVFDVLIDLVVVLVIPGLLVITTVDVPDTLVLDVFELLEDGDIVEDLAGDRVFEIDPDVLRELADEREPLELILSVGLSVILADTVADRVTHVLRVEDCVIVADPVTDRLVTDDTVTVLVT